MRGRLHRHLRYFTAFPCGEFANGTKAAAPDALTCLIFKEDVWETWQAGSASADGLNFEGVDPALVRPMRWGKARLTHNLAVLRRADGTRRGELNQSLLRRSLARRIGPVTI
ncbi:MAG: hypothetical protein ACON4Z_17455 [Planctomycetota bacterium]